jgi:class 3 adenylate cyclase/CHASE2 domain-containing sensor protein
MLKLARKIARDSLVSGVMLTIIVVVVSAGGLLENAERWLYDKRVATCQFFLPPPTDKLVHLDIDDSVLDTIGRWPWNREVLAEMFDELRLAGPKVVATDVQFSEPQEPRLFQREDGTFDRVDDDALLAESIRKLGCVIVPMSLPFGTVQKLDPIQERMRLMLQADPELSQPELVAKLAPLQLAAGPVLQARVARDYLAARREAVYLRVRQELLTAPGTREQIRHRVLKQSDDELSTTVMRVFEEEYEHATAEVALRKFEQAIPPGMPPLLSSETAIPPIPALARVAAGTAFFDYPTEQDGKVRRVPLFMEHAGLMVPQIGLSLAAAMVGARIDQIRADANHVEIPRENASPIVLPVYTFYSESQHRKVPMMFDIPWFGTSSWETMYQSVGGAHLSLNVVWEIRQTSQKIRKNNVEARDALNSVYEAADPDKLGTVAKLFANLDDPQAGQTQIRAALADDGSFIEAARQTDPKGHFDSEADRDNTLKLAAAGPALSHTLAENPRLAQQLLDLRSKLRELVHGKAVLIGWAATSQVADTVPTPLHAKCPGVVIHGTIFNAIMTGRFLTRLPPWGNLAITALCGLVTTVLASRLSPTRAFGYALLIAAFYAAINGIVLYDRLGYIVTLAGPLVVIGVVWAGCTLIRLLAESVERAHITRRFRSYADPSLVDYVMENPDAVRLTGEKRELTVCFTDLADFTTIAERLGEAAVPLLNDFMDVAIPIIARHGGYVNKFLGDGIMFFFGAPRHVPDHAARAVETILSLKAAMVQFNQRSHERNLPRLVMRAGISAGEMVVGDAGSKDRSDYTVLGDIANLGARLETANKFMGTQNLVNHRVIELAGDRFLYRPVGNILFKGKRIGVRTYEVLGLRETADAAQRRLAELSGAIVDAYTAANAAGCLAAIEQMEGEFGRDKFTMLFRELYETRLRPAEAGTFDPMIVLTEK